MGYVERDWVQELEERRLITSAEMQFFVNRMGARATFNAPELAGVLNTSVNTVYALVDSESERVKWETGKSRTEARGDRICEHTGQV